MPMTRRRFLAGCTSAAVAGAASRGWAADSGVRIDRIELFPVRYPTVGYFKFFQGPSGYYGRPAVFVKITADDGTVGWGQSVPVITWGYESLASATVIMRDHLVPALVGRDPTDIEGANEAMDRAVRPALTTGMPLARAGLDIALHDLTGKLGGKSLAEMWGLPRGGPIRLSWTVNVRELHDTDDVIAAGRERGYGNFNIKVAPDPEFDAALARRVKELVPDGFLWADANGGYDPAAALEAARRLADAGVDVLEAPIRPNELSGYQALRKQAALPILMDEGIVSPVELREFIKLGMLNGVAMKPSRCAGLLSAKRQIELLEEAGLMWLGSGLCDPDVSLAATLCLFGAFGLKKPAALNAPQFLTHDVLTKPLKPKGDTIEVPAGPGLGIEVDEEKIAELIELTKKSKSQKAATGGRE